MWICHDFPVPVQTTTGYTIIYPLKDCWLSSECHLGPSCANWEPPQMLQALASLSERTHIQDPQTSSDKSTSFFGAKKKNTVPSCCWVLNGVFRPCTEFTQLLESNPEIRSMPEVQKPPIKTPLWILWPRMIHWMVRKLQVSPVPHSAGKM